MLRLTIIGMGSLEASARRRWPCLLASLLKAATSSWARVDFRVNDQGNSAEITILELGWLP